MLRHTLALGAILWASPTKAEADNSKWDQILALIKVSPDMVHASSCNERLQVCSEVWASRDVLGKHISAAIRRDMKGKFLYREACRFEAGDTKRTCIDLDTGETTNEIRVAPGQWKEIK